MNIFASEAASNSAHMVEWLIAITNLGLILVTLALVLQGIHDTNALVKIVAMLTGRGKAVGRRGKHER